MVKQVFVIGILIILSTQAKSNEESEEEKFSPDSLRSVFKGETERKKSASERMKASRGDRDSLTILQEKDLNYKLPNGDYVLGMLLPNGKLSPAVRTKFGKRPACVTKEFSLIRGIWDANVESIVCNIPLSELAYVEKEGLNYTSTKIDSTTNSPTPTSNKYSKVAVINEDQNVNDIANVDTSNNENIEVIKPTQSSKYGTKTHVDSSSGKIKTKNNTNAVTTGANTGYIPPPRNNTKTSSIAAVMQSSRKEFGIPKGTWVKAKLERTANSAEQSDIEFVLLESISGKVKEIPAGTVFFASKTFNNGNDRLEALTSVGVTPEGEQIDGFKAFVYAQDKTAGLTGTIIRDREGEAISAGATSLLASTASAIPSGANFPTKVVSSFAGEMLSNEQEHIPNSPEAVISVSPQVVWLRIEEAL